MKRILSVFIMIIMCANPSLGAMDEIPSFDKEAFIASAAVRKELRINMVDCVAMALKNNSEILVKRIDPQIADSNVRIQKSRFEPVLTFDFLMQDNTDLSTNTLVGNTTSKTRTGIFDFGYEQKWVTGTQTDLVFTNTRTRSNSIVQSSNPEYNSEAAIVVTQPLLKGFGIIVNKADFLIAKNNRTKSVEDFTKNVIDVITNVKKAYYEYQYRQEEYKVAIRSLRRVTDLYDIAKEKYSKGLASNVDLIQSEAEVARFDEAVFASENVVNRSQDNLKYITNLIDDPELWNADIRLLDEVSMSRKECDLVKSILTAFDNRPDYKAAKLDLANRGISVIFYRNNMLPALDLIGSYGLNGLGKNYEKDLGHIGGGKYQDWSIGVNFRMPFFSDKEKGEYEKSKYEKAQTLIAFKRLEQKIILEVRDAVRNIDTLGKVVDASKKSLDAEDQNYTAQVARFKAGLVSMLDMVIYQERLARAEVNYVKAVIDYDVAICELARVEGTTLRSDNIIIDFA